ncbi:hypothetical protein FRC02_006568 [Tulasnella sp. 418]|nr:hypothetical protein FRC02_006568 [Tulasnella sp. 418]
MQWVASASINWRILKQGMLEHCRHCLVLAARPRVRQILRPIMLIHIPTRHSSIYSNVFNGDQLLRLQNRVADLERTVRVLMQRPLRTGSGDGMEGLDERVVAVLESLSGTSSDTDSSKRKKSRVSPSNDPGESLTGYPGYPTGSSSLLQIPLVPGLRLTASGSPESTSPLSSHRHSSAPPDPSSIIDFSLLGSSDTGKSSLPHCGCASTPDGRKLYTQLQTSMGDSLQKLSSLASHQRQGTFCHLFASLQDLLESVRSAAQAKSLSPPQQAFATPSPVSAFGPHTTYPQPHSHSSNSPPLQHPSTSLSYQTITGYNPTTIPQQSSYPYSYPSSHISDLSQPSSQLSSSPPLGMATISSRAYSQPMGHLQLPTSGVMGMGAHQPPAVPTSSGFSTLSAWDDMAGPSSLQSKARTSSSTRTGSKHSSRSPYDPRYGK